MKTKAITPTEVRYIKLGGGGEWESSCIESSRPTIRLGFVSPYHKGCLMNRWGPVSRYWATKTTKGKATEYLNQIRDFYTLGGGTLWITFFKRRLFWCFARTRVEELSSGDRVRRVIGKWSSKSVTGEELFIDSLSGKLTQMRGFRGTICHVNEKEYLLRKINGEKMPDVVASEKALAGLHRSLVPLVQRLNWKNFELLVDFIFSNAGWRRNSRVGATEKDVDLDLSSPVSGRWAFVQIKSQADEATLRKYAKAFLASGHYDEMYFAVHSPCGDAESWKLPERVRVLGPDPIVVLAVSAGLTAWILQKSA